jgi:SAM-dependent methyltransferase
MAMVSPLFPSGSVTVAGEHCAMLDGRRASFACSTVQTPDISADDSRNWQWSADLAHHVLITPNTVQVRSGRDPIARQFQRDSVESRLEEFLTFLDGSRRSALPDVVSFLIDEFRAIWATSGSPDGATALVPFLLSLCASDQVDSAIIEDPAWRRNTALDIGIEGTSLGEAQFNQATIDRAHGIQERAPLGLRLMSSLVFRHAAGRLFQEAHAIIETTQLDLFGNSLIVTAPTYSPAGAYFTPVPIARLLADWALPRVSFPNELSIADYACGSAVFLTEALRTLERRGFTGIVRLIGRDKSPEAIRMAKVAVRTTQRDLHTMQVNADISQADALDSPWPEADICLMNPPFRSWERMNQRERDWVQEVTKSNGRGRPDLSVGFVERAIRALRPAGVLATLVPAGVFASDSLSTWRNGLTDRGTPSLVAVLGEHGLFEHALVNVGILAFQSGPRSQTTALQPPLCVAWSSAETGAASRVIRAIRRSISEPTGTESSNGWSLTMTSLDVWKRRPSWLPGAGALGPLLDALQVRIRTKVSDIFRVRQGIRTGDNEVFVQPRKMVETLPKHERTYFREAVDAASFVDGEIKPRNCLFVPDESWQSEAEVSRAVPRFFSGYLQPRKDSLLKRKRKSKDPSRWWELTWPRVWAFDGRPRLVSKRFGLYPAFARDLGGSFAVVQANAWIPTDHLSTGGDDVLRELLTAYWWLLNSRIVVALFREYCPNVAGGQLDLEHKYVRHVPLPYLSQEFRENPALQMLASSIRTRSADRLPNLSDRDHFAAAAFGTDVSEWNLSGLELPD